MPFLSVSLSAVPSPDVVDKVAAQLTELTAIVLGKKRELTAVAISVTPAKTWYIAGSSLVNQSLTSFYFDIKVTEGTNTKNEKAAYVSQVFSAMSELLGPLAPASYIVIHEVHADAWGYEGQTQEFRYIKGKPL
jgi:4-oxalocrotonate tautomerase